jgi:uncharacterized protein YcnI
MNTSLRARRLGRRSLIGAAAASALVLALGAGGASAHVGVDQDEIAAGESTVLTFSVGHGCAGSPTNSMRFQVPADVLNAQPLVKPGWDISIEREQLQAPVESGHGQEQTDRVAVVTFTATEGNALPNDYRDTFSLAFRAPETEGELFFKVVQGCEEGENPWIEERDGTGEEPEHPAPSVQVVAATAADSGATPVADVADVAEVAGSVPVGGAEQSDDDGSDGLAIAALVVGGLGLVAGGAALVRSRRPAS